jgi:hypothetical protein
MGLASGEGWDERPIAEPTLATLVADPLVRLVMDSDRVDPRWLHGFLVELAQRRAAAVRRVLDEPDGSRRSAANGCSWYRALRRSTRRRSDRDGAWPGID